MPTHPVQPPEWIDSAPIRVERSIDIAAPPSLVWGLIVNHVDWPTWFTTLDSVEVVGAGSGIGGGRRVTMKKLTLDEQFTAWDEDRHFAFAVVKSKIPILDTMAESVRIEATDVRLHGELSPGAAGQARHGKVARTDVEAGGQGPGGGARQSQVARRVGSQLTPPARRSTFASRFRRCGARETRRKR